MKFDIPINFIIEANNEFEAEAIIYQRLNKWIAKTGMGEIIEFQNFEFITEEPCSSGCGDNHCC